MGGVGRRGCGAVPEAPRVSGKRAVEVAGAGGAEGDRDSRRPDVGSVGVGGGGVIDVGDGDGDGSLGDGSVAVAEAIPEGVFAVEVEAGTVGDGDTVGGSNPVGGPVDTGYGEHGPVGIAVVVEYRNHDRLIFQGGGDVVCCLPTEAGDGDQMRARGPVVVDAEHGLVGTGRGWCQRNAAARLVAVTNGCGFQLAQREVGGAVQLHRCNDHRRVDEPVPDVPNGQVLRHRGRHLDRAQGDVGRRFELRPARLGNVNDFDGVHPRGTEQAPDLHRDGVQAGSDHNRDHHSGPGAGDIRHVEPIDDGVSVDGDVEQRGGNRIGELGEEEPDLIHPRVHREHIPQRRGFADPSRLEQASRDSRRYRGMGQRNQ